MRPFGNTNEIIYDKLDMDVKRKSPAAKAKKTRKVRQRRKFRAQLKNIQLKMFA